MSKTAKEEWKLMMLRELEKQLLEVKKNLLIRYGKNFKEGQLYQPFEPLRKSIPLLRRLFKRKNSESFIDKERLQELKPLAQEIADILVQYQGKKIKGLVKHGGYWAEYPFEGGGPSYFREVVRIPTAEVAAFLNLLRLGFELDNPQIEKALNRALLFTGVLFLGGASKLLGGWSSIAADAEFILARLTEGYLALYSAERYKKCQELELILDAFVQYANYLRETGGLNVSSFYNVGSFKFRFIGAGSEGGEAFSSLQEQFKMANFSPEEFKLTLPYQCWFKVFDEVLGKDDKYCVQLSQYKEKCRN